MAEKPEPARRTSPQSVLRFLKQAALEPSWTAAYAASVLGMAKEVAAEVAPMGYAEPMPGSATGGATPQYGNTVAGY
jgi:hypothetical protein